MLRQSQPRRTCCSRGSPLIGAIDEVYPATFLAYAGLQGETNCAGYATSVEFLPHTEHPTSYPAEAVTADLCVVFRSDWAELVHAGD